MVAYNFPFPELTKWSAKYAVEKEKIIAGLRRECEKKYPLSDDDERLNPYPEHKQKLMFETNMYELSRAMECACIQNRLVYVEWITEKFGATLRCRSTLGTIWEKGYLEMMQLVALPEDIQEEGLRLLLFACERNRFEQARWLVTNYAARIADIGDLHARFAMSYVMEKCDVKMAELVWPLLSMHFDADIAFTLVGSACLSGNTGMIEWLLSRAPWKQELAAAFEAADYGALYTACNYGHPATAQWLVDCFRLPPACGLLSILHLNDMRASYLHDIERPDSRLNRWFSKAVLKRKTTAKKHCANAEQFARALADWLSIPGAETMPFIELLHRIIAASDNKKKFETELAMFASIRWA
jgi:hypothetical protein